MLTHDLTTHDSHRTQERKALEAAVRAKEDALREDENVFDVSYEGMGEEVSATATDVKVRACMGAAACLQCRGHSHAAAGGLSARACVALMVRGRCTHVPKRMSRCWRGKLWSRHAH